MHPSALPIVEDISLDVPTVKKWEQTTLSSDLPNATLFTGQGKRWTHHLVVWKAEKVERCDGTAVSLTEAKGLVVRYTRGLAAEVFERVKATR